MDDTMRLTTEAELDALAVVQRLLTALAQIRGFAKRNAELTESLLEREQYTWIAETASAALGEAPGDGHQAAGSNT